MSRTDKTVSISFFELLLLPDEKRISSENWVDRLNSLRSDSAKEIEYSGRTLDGIIFGDADEPCLSLSIDRPNRPRERQRKTGVRKTMQNSAEDFDPAEETIVVFFERNIFGVLSTGVGAPSHSAVASWLNKFSRPNQTDASHTWRAAQITRDDIYSSVIKQKGMKVTSSSFSAKADSLRREDYGILGLIADRFTNTADGFTIEITMRAGRMKGREQNTQYIEESVDKIIDTLPSSELTKAKVTAKGSSGPQRAFDILSDSVTHKIAIPSAVFDNDADFVSVSNKEIRSAYSELRDVILGQIPATIPEA